MCIILIITCMYVTVITLYKFRRRFTAMTTMYTIAARLLPTVITATATPMI